LISNIEIELRNIGKVFRNWTDLTKHRPSKEDDISENKKTIEERTGPKEKEEIEEEEEYLDCSPIIRAFA